MMRLTYFITILILDSFSASEVSVLQQQITNMKVIFNHEIEFLKKLIWIDLTGNIERIRHDVSQIKADMEMPVNQEIKDEAINSAKRSLKDDMILDALRKEKYISRSLQKRNNVLQKQMEKLVKEMESISSFRVKIGDKLHDITKVLNQDKPNKDWVEVYRNEIQRVRSFQRPSYISPWLLMKSEDNELSELTVEHGLGALPYKVDILVKPTDGPNAGWIFQGDSTFRNDDDRQPMYGGVVYMYDENKVTLRAPKKSNNFDTGQVVYTGSQNSRRLGNNHQESITALVRVKVWGADDLPAPDFESNWLPLDIKNSSLAYYELEHGLKEYPALVNVQIMNEKTGIISEGVSSSVAPRPYLNGGGTIWGFNNETVRLWSACNINRTKGIYHKPIGGGDGWGNGFVSDLAADTAKVKVRAWSSKHIIMNQNGFIGKAEPKNFEFGPFDIRNKPSEADMVIFHIEARDGPNKGYRFKGYGSSQAKDDGYGGCVFAYSDDGLVRAWPPNPEQKGHLIYIIPPYGNGQNTQISDKAVYVYSMIKTWP